jgi:hypothetical protein
MKWISVRAMRPRRGKRVLCLHEDGSIHIEAMLSGGEFYYDALYGPVTHWMPLPVAPGREARS